MQSLKATATGTVLQQRQQQSSRRPSYQPFVVAQQAASQSASSADGSRRSALLGMGALLAGASLNAAVPQLAQAANPAAAVPVGDYLPSAEGLPGFCRYQPDSKKTPAIRAGVIKPNPEYYEFAVPASWSEGQLLNILTGNFCMPRCEEPWYEALFESPKEGKVQLIVAELQKLNAKPNAKLEDLGTPEQVITRVGNFVTGSYLDEEDVLSAERKALGDGRDYYLYEVYAPYAKNPGHNLAAFTVKGDLAYIFVLTATDKQWAANEGKLRTMLETFRA